MKKYIVKSLQHPLISGSGVIFLGSLGGNFFHFLFNLFMSRNLAVSEYGVLASIVSLTTLPALLYTAITPTVVNFAAGYFANNQYDYVHGLYRLINRLAIFVGGGFLLFFSIFSAGIATFFHIDNSSYLIIAGMMIMIGFVSIVNISFIQAKLAFTFLGFLNFITGILKFTFGVLFIFLGLKVGGSLGAIFMAGLLVYIISFFPIRFILHKGVMIPTIHLKQLVTYAVPATGALLSVTCFITTDILFAKHFFTPKEAGLYAGLALVGKVIFFFSAPIGMAMFPLIVHKREKNENYRSIFNLSLLLVLIPSLLMTAFYYFFPEFTVRFFLKNNDYLSISSILWIYGLYMTLYSLLSVITNYFLSIRETRIAIPLLLGAGLQAVLLWYYHNTFVQVIYISTLIVACLLCILFFNYYFLYEQKK